MSRLILVLSVFAISSVAFAQAGTDCKAQSDQAVQNCSERIAAAKSSDVSQYGQADGMPDGGGAQAGAAYAVRAKIGEAANKCTSADLQACVDQCNAALKDAQSKRQSSLMQKIKGNMSSCSNRIDRNIASAQAAQNSLTKVAADSNNSANEACNEGETCGKPDPNVMQANSPCPQGMFWSVRFNQCTGIMAFTPRDMIPTPFGK
jgi:hypothetical protein